MNASKILSRLVVSAGAGLLGVTVRAAVVNVATDGNDETGDGSAGAPFATVMRALEAASDGDTVQLADGTYGERNISITKAVTVRGNASDRTRVLFDAQKAGRVFIVNDPNAVLADLSVANAYLDQVDAIPVSLDGHTANKVGGASLVLTQGTATNCVFAGGDANWESAIGGNVFVMRGLVVGCRLDGGRTAGYGANAYMYGGRLSRCEIVNGVVCSKGQGISMCSSAAVHAWPEMGDAVVDNCLIAGHKNLSVAGNSGGFVSTIYVGGTGSGRMIVANCTIVDNLGSTAAWQRCLRVVAESGRRAPLVINTVLFNNGGTAETEWDGSLSTLSCAHNCASTVAMEGSENYTVLSTDATEVFVSSEDFHPCPGSALVSAGVAGDYDQYVGDVDLDGRPRLKDNGVTLGCYELLSGQIGGLVPSKRYADVDEPVSFRVVTVDDVTGWRFRWTFGDGSPVIETDGPATTHAYSAPGVYDPSVSLSTDGGATWSEEVSFKGLTVSERPGFYVATTGDDVFGDGSVESPVATIGKGIALASADKDRTTVYVAAGTYAEFGLSVSSGITIRGAGRDKTIVDGESRGRVFFVDHPSAVLADLTIRNGKTTTTTTVSKDGITASYVAGANLCLVDGTVTNCILKDGASTASTYVCGGNAFVLRGTIVDSRLDGGQCDGLGAGAYMYGGRISRCEIINGVACPDGVTPANCGSAAVHAWAAASDAIIENCLIASNKCLATGSNGGYAGVCDTCGTDNHAMILVNCTIADNLGSTVNWEPCIRVVSHANRKQPKLINCLLFNNGNTAWLEWGNARSTLSYFHNCAAAVAIPGGDNCTLIPTTDAAKVFALGGTRPFEPAHKSALCGKGSVSGYSDYAVSTKDVYGKKRLVGDSIDIGCAERQGPGFAVIVQ